MRFIITAILSFTAMTANADEIWGGWYGVGQGQAQGTLAFSFFPDGEYFLNDHGIRALDPTGQPGIERGTYTWNAATGAFSSITLVDTDGQWGLSNPSPTSPNPTSITITGDTLTGSYGNVAIVGLTRLTDANSPIVGSWYLANNPNAGNLTVITFLPNGTYLLGSDPPSTGDLEFGTYTWQKDTGAFSFQVIDTTNPNVGLNGSTISSIKVVNGGLVIASSDGTFDLANVAGPVPEPATYALMLAGLGMIAFAARRKLH
jgi:hypothetical protein